MYIPNISRWTAIAICLCAVQIDNSEADVVPPQAPASATEASENVDQAWVTQNLTSMLLALPQNINSIE